LLEQEFGPVKLASRVYNTEPWGKTDQDHFFNQALIFDVSMRPMRVLDTVLAIESKLGRVRFEKWGPRSIDIDIIFFGDLVFEGDRLRIPHPHLQERSFVLEPLMELVPDFKHPVTNRSISEMFSDLLSAN